MSLAVSMVTRLWRRPRMQLWPLLVCMVQSTASDFSWYREPTVRTHGSPSAGRTNTSRSASKVAPEDHIARFNFTTRVAPHFSQCTMRTDRRP